MNRTSLQIISALLSAFCILVTLLFLSTRSTFASDSLPRLPESIANFDTEVPSVGPGTYENTETTYIGYAGTWTTQTNQNASGGNFARSDVVGSTAKLKVKDAAAITIGITKKNNYGRGRVYIDDVNQGNFDAYSPDFLATTIGPYTLDGTGVHIIKIEVLHTKRDDSGGYFVGLDYFLVIAPTPTPTNTSTKTNTPTNTSTNTPTNTPTKTNTPTNTFTNTPTKTATNTPIPPTNTPTFTPTATFTPTYTPTSTPTNTATWTPTYTATPTLTFTATATETETPTSTPTATSITQCGPTPTPTFTPSPTETGGPTPPNTPTPSPTPRCDSFALIERAFDNGAITVDQAAEYRLYAIFGSDLLPSPYQSDELIPTDGLGAVGSAVENWDQLSDETKLAMINFISPQTIIPDETLEPTATLLPSPTPTIPLYNTLPLWLTGCDLDQSILTEHFIIYYTTTGDCSIVNNTVSNYLAKLESGLEAAYDKFHNDFQYRPQDIQPYPIYVVKMRVGLKDVFQSPIGGRAITLVNGMYITNEYFSQLDIQAAHEYFHSVQWIYQRQCLQLNVDIGGNSYFFPITFPWLSGGDNLRWWMEASADWAQNEVFPGDPMYLEDIDDYLSRPWHYMNYRPIQNTEKFPYSALFPTYLAENLTDGKDVIRQTWETYRLNNILHGCGDMMETLEDVLAARNTSMEQIFPSYAEANYTLAYNNPDFRVHRPIDNPSGRPNPDQQPLSSPALTVDGPPQSRVNSVDHFGASYIEFENNLAPQGRDLFVSINITTTTNLPIVKIWTVNQYNPTVISTTVVPAIQYYDISVTRHVLVNARVPNFDLLTQGQRVAVAIINQRKYGPALTYDYVASVIPRTTLYAGGYSSTNSSGVGWISQDDGVTWQSHSFTNSGFVQAVAAVPNAQGQIGYFATSDLKLRKTIDGGLTFSSVDLGPIIQNDVLNAKFSVLKIDPNNSNTIYVGVRGNMIPPRVGAKGALYKSTDGGQVFGSDLLANCHAQSPINTTDCEITSLSIDPSDSDILWIGQRGGDSGFQTIMRSINGGTHWVSRFSSGDDYTRLAMSPVDQNTVWALTQNGLSGQSAYHTADGGNTWTNNPPQIDNTHIPTNRTILADPLSQSAAWASAGNQGLYQTTDNGQTWVRLYADFHELGILVPQALYGVRQGIPGLGAVEISTNGGKNWYYLGVPEMVGLDNGDAIQSLSVVKY